MKKDFSLFFKIISETIAKLSEEEVSKLISGEGKLMFCDNERFLEKAVAKTASYPIIEELKVLTNREEASNLLHAKGILKNDLIAIAAFLKVHIKKSDSKAKIIEKIIDGTVGVTLRSLAIKEISN